MHHEYSYFQDARYSTDNRLLLQTMEPVISSQKLRFCLCLSVSRITQEVVDKFW